MPTGATQSLRRERRGSIRSVSSWLFLPSLLWVSLFRRRTQGKGIEAPKERGCIRPSSACHMGARFGGMQLPRARADSPDTAELVGLEESPPEHPPRGQHADPLNHSQLPGTAPLATRARAWQSSSGIDRKDIGNVLNRPRACEAIGQWSSKTRSGSSGPRSGSNVCGRQLDYRPSVKDRKPRRPTQPARSDTNLTVSPSPWRAPRLDVHGHTKTRKDAS